MAKGYIQPGSKTQQLWDELILAKTQGDRLKVGELTQEIRRVSIELLRAGEREYGNDQNKNHYTPQD